MAPAHTLFTFLSCSLVSLQVATTTQMASQLRHQDRQAASCTLGASLSLAASLGVELAAVLLLVAPAMAASAAAAPGALQYIQIRALSIPAVLVTLAAQGGGSTVLNM
jgi:Na+-driven multidrug efflux pump